MALGLVLVGMVSGIVAAVTSIVIGYPLWAALIFYLGFGSAAAAAMAVFLYVLFASEDEREDMVRIRSDGGVASLED